MDNLPQVPLHLPDVRVLSMQRTEEDHWPSHVESILERTHCRCCGLEIRDLHGVEAAVRLHHLPRFDVPVWIEIRPTRYRCPDCAGHPTTTHGCAGDEPRSPNGTAYAPWALRMLSNSTVADAARTLGDSEETIDGLLDRWIERPVDWDIWARLGVIGLGEIALKHGHRDVVALVTVPLEEGGVESVAVLADRTKQTIAGFVHAVPEILRRPIERTCTDMYERFVNAIKEAIPWAEIVIDRFHGARAYRDYADTVHQTALTRRKRALPNADYVEITGVMWLFRQQPGDLKPEERALIELLLRYSPKIAAACHLRQDLTDLGVRNDTTAGAKRALRVWCTRVRERGLAECESFLGTRDWWREEITPGFQGRQTSGLVEGFNNRVQVLKRCCDGIFNIGSLSQRFTLDWHGYQLSGHP